ncbi:hypothetical protein BpHYR1_053767 [Brachionus plicatilis]|uniref:Uncharacterized protein n=1 Tax=Brachionus plicatilis TaxID=10195 RepID=A0A3M7RPT7_BRAPC|nr:hypothetical protein BpHYR1_053767 [Brachionus plicatilis]
MTENIVDDFKVNIDEFNVKDHIGHNGSIKMENTSDNKKLIKRKRRRITQQALKCSRSKELTLKIRKKITKYKRKFLLQFTQDEKSIYKLNRQNDLRLSKNFPLPWERRKKNLNKRNNFLKNLNRENKLHFESKLIGKSELNLSKNVLNTYKFNIQNNYEFEIMRQNLIESKNKTCQALSQTENYKQLEKQSICKLISKVLKTKS